MATLDRNTRELLAYFALTFVISWGAVLAVVLPTVGIPAPAAAFSTQGTIFAASVFALLLGPPVASLVLLAFLGDEPVLRALRSPHARVPLRAWALTMIAPATLVVVLGLLSTVDPVYRPGILGATKPAIAMGILYALGAGFFEELGWTGFATPRLVARYGAVRGGILLGAVWTLWHVLPIFTFTAETYGVLYVGNLLQSFVFLGSFRVVMTIVWTRTQSLLLSQVLHFSLTATSILVAPSSTTPAQTMVWNSLWPISLAIVAAAMVAASRTPSARRVRHA